MRSRRAILYMPGDDLHKIRKAITLSVDCICMDLEDAVATVHKQAARKTTVEALQTLDFGKSEKLVRVNGAQTEYFEEDLKVILPALPDGLVVPKVEDDKLLQLVNDLMAKVEEERSQQVGSMCLIAIVETARGILNLREICCAVPRLSALIFGAEDLAVSIGATRTASNREVFYARSKLVLHTAAYGLDAIDMVNNDYRDLETLHKEAREGAQLGYVGKQVIHPNQAPVVQEAFTPLQVDIDWAQMVVKTYEAQQQEGVGAIGVEGKLIDMPIYKQAQNILARARAAELLAD